MFQTEVPLYIKILKFYYSGLLAKSSLIHLGVFYSTSKWWKDEQTDMRP